MSVVPDFPGEEDDFSRLHSAIEKWEWRAAKKGRFKRFVAVAAR
jgi:hypothetical protein